MKKCMTIIFIVLIFILTGCFSTRTKLFYLPLEEDTYLLHETSKVLVNQDGDVISYLSVSFTNLQQTVLEDDDFSVNTLGDFSFIDIKLFEIEFYMGLNNEDPIKYDLVFIGRANPGRGNAYAFTTTMDVLHQEHTEFRIVLELNKNIGGLDDRIGHIRLQLNNKMVSGIGVIVTLRNDLEIQRNEALTLLTETFFEFKRDDYDQEAWDEIHHIYRHARETINKALDSETISIWIAQAIEDFSKVPTIN